MRVTASEQCCYAVQTTRRDFPNAGQHEGEPRLPSKFNCMLFFVFRRPVVVFGGQTFLAFEQPPSGVKSKRIFLSADAASILRFNPCGSYLTVVLLFSAWSRGLRLAKRSTPKKSVSCVSVRVVLVMSEPIRLVFIGLLHFVIFVVRET